MAQSPTPFTPGWRPKTRDDVVFRQVGEDWVLFDPVAGRIHVLDLTAALLWSFCTGESEVPSLEEEVRRAFGAAVDDPQVPKALRGFLDAGLFQVP
jgi:hypothetical protein